MIGQCPSQFPEPPLSHGLELAGEWFFLLRQDNQHVVAVMILNIIFLIKIRNQAIEFILLISGTGFLLLGCRDIIIHH